VARCARSKLVSTPIPAFPPLTPSSTAPAGASQTLAAAANIVREAQATWLLTAKVDGGSTTVAGLTHGRAITSIRRIKLTDYGIDAGVWLTGELMLEVGLGTTASGPDIHFAGTLTVGGPRAAHGTVTVAGDRVNGVLDGRSVSR